MCITSTLTVIYEEGGWWLMPPEFLLKGCPKCGGDLLKEGDAYGNYTKCVQCGRIFESKSTTKPTRGAHK